NVLKASLIDDVFAQCLRVADLNGVLGVERVVRLARQAGLSDTVVFLFFAVILIADGQSIRRRELIVEARSEIGAGARVFNDLRELNRVEVRVQSRRVDDGDVVGIAAINVEKE